MYFLSLLTTVLAVCGAGAVPSPDHYVLHEKRNSPPAQWMKRSKVPADATLPVRIALRQRNAEAGHEHLMAMSDPRSPSFGRHWTSRQVRDFFAPDDGQVDAVREWLAESDIDVGRQKVTSGRGHIRFEARVDEVERLLRAEFDLWEHAGTGALGVSCDGYHVPHRISHLVDFVTPGVVLDGPRSSSSHAKERVMKRGLSQEALLPPPTFVALPKNYSWSKCSDGVTPDCLKKLYNVPPPMKAYPDNDFGLYESADSSTEKSIDLFNSLFAKNIPKGTRPILQSVDGGNPNAKHYSSIESDLDIEVVYPLIYPQQIKLYQVYDTYTLMNLSGLYDSFLDALDASYCQYDGGDDPNYDPKFPDGHGWNKSEQCGVYKPTNVISISYGQDEASFSPAYEIRQCNEFLKLALQGTSVIVSSGDFGTIGASGCLSNGRQNPDWPATCPYVTTAGATQISRNDTSPHPEEAVAPSDISPPNIFTSGGGFSNVFARPWWQDAAVKGFLDNSTRLPAKGSYNASGRAYPDIAAVGFNITTANASQVGLTYGSSASAPIFGALITRINGERIAAGKGPVGFLNPILYAFPDMFNDITTGLNYGCNAKPSFHCKEGWDPVTGLGTPNYPEMLKVFMKLP